MHSVCTLTMLYSTSTTNIALVKLLCKLCYPLYGVWQFIFISSKSVSHCGKHFSTVYLIKHADDRLN